jgi:hypothetical protein
MSTRSPSSKKIRKRKNTNVKFLLAYYKQRSESVILTRVNLNASHKLQNARIQMRSAQEGH